MLYRISNLWNQYKSSAVCPSLPKPNSGIVSRLLFGKRSSSNDMEERKEYEMEGTEFGDDSFKNYQYWAGRSERWPNLSKMAKDLLTIPATSAACERTFSTGRALFGLYRMNLKPKTVEALICLRSWYSHVQKNAAAWSNCRTQLCLKIVIGLK